MPLIETSSFCPPFFLTNGHFQTIWPYLVRRVPWVYYTRERLNISDGDFLDLDWFAFQHERLAILSHGLEGSSNANYIRGMARSLALQGWDTLAWNFRSCSGSPNRLPRLYHSGASEDLAEVLDHILERFDYEEIVLIGFSVGGNIVLKYLGERGGSYDPRLKAAVTFSVPVDLASSARHLSLPHNRLYLERFMRSMRRRAIRRLDQLPLDLSVEEIRAFSDFLEFDEHITAPLHGFRDAADYYERASSKPHLSTIEVPTLLINAANDPFLTPKCYPVEEAQSSRSLFLEIPRSGGHCGFYGQAQDRIYWSEHRALEFMMHWLRILRDRQDLSPSSTF